MNDTELWWVDKAKFLYRFPVSNTYPKEIQQEGRLYLNQSDPLEGGYDNIYDVSALPNVDLTTLTTNKLFRGRSYKTSDAKYARAYDALRRTGWSVKHTNKLDGVQDNQLRASIDQDLVVSTKELNDRSSLLCFVAGVYHKHIVDPSSSDVYISDGAQTLRNDRTNKDVTIVDFSYSGGCILADLTEDMIVHPETLPRSLLIDITKLNVSFNDYTPYLIIDGYLHPVGITHRTISSRVIEVTVSTLNLIYNYLTSPCLRQRALPIPVTDGVNPLSDMHDTYLDKFIDNTVVDKEDFNSNDWILSRVTSVHSALLLLPKTTVALKQEVHHETDEVWWATAPTKASRTNSVLNLDGKIFSPLYLHTEGYRTRTLLSVPYRENKMLWSLKDPLSSKIASPDKDVKDDQVQFNTGSIIQWWNIPIIGEL